MKKILGWVALVVALVTALYFGALAAGVPDDVAITCFIGVAVFLSFIETTFVETRWLANTFRQPVVSVYKSTIVASCVIAAFFASLIFFGERSLHDVFRVFTGLLSIWCPLLVFMTAVNHKDRVGLVFFAHLVGIGGICGVAVFRAWWPAAVAVAVLGTWWLWLHAAEKLGTRDLVV